ncbi:MAG: hypothetical protein CFH31_00662 [Alphaproteobacteria bacterium MarineAlpha9_Bin1]|nr:MAG: hypothetical protein CFH31_00662 [Alphaproteobacteria bacterium MarineAlpha9_Bin1]
MLNINFNGEGYQKNKGSLFNPSVSWAIGLSKVRSPYKVDYNITYTPYDLITDVLLYYGQTEYDSGDAVVLPPNKLSAYHFSHNISFGYDILPDFFIRPFIGIGYQYSGINIYFKKEGKQNNTSKTSDIFVHGELIYTINSNYFLGLSFANSLTLDEKSWQNIYFKIGKIFISNKL